MMSDPAIIGRLLLAAFLGGLVGLEREIFGRAAGLRTHILVCVSSALLMLVSIYVADQWLHATSDPGRIAAQVVTGVGFLGAGTIIRSKETIRGLTTAASIWTVSAIGLAVGIGFYTAAVATTVITLIALYLFTRIEWRFSKRAPGEHADEGMEG